MRCPVCRSVPDAPTTGLSRDGGTVRCVNNHAFDVARQGYLNLGASQKDARADTAAMVMARGEMHASGAFDGVARALCEALEAHTATLAEGDTSGLSFADLAGGLGFYAAQILDTMPHRFDRGLVLDLSVAALKRAAAYPGLAAIGADLTRGVPLVDGSVAALVNVFGPRNGAEMRRVLAPGGAAVVVSPSAAHLAELVEPLGMLSVADGKADRVERAMEGFDIARRDRYEERLDFDERQLTNIIAMGPSAHHVNGETIARRVSELLHRTGSPTVAVTMSVDVTTFTAPGKKSVRRVPPAG